MEIYTFHYTTFLNSLCSLTHFVCEGLFKVTFLALLWVYAGKSNHSICNNCYFLNLVSEKLNFSSCVRKKLPTLIDRNKIKDCNLKVSQISSPRFLSYSFGKMAFKLFNNLFEPFNEAVASGESSDVAAVASIDIRHQVIILDRNLFRFREELLLVIEPLKFCLLLAVHISRFGNPKTELPTVSVMVSKLSLANWSLNNIYDGSPVYVFIIIQFNFFNKANMT